MEILPTTCLLALLTLVVIHFARADHNALTISLALRDFPEHLQKRGILRLGSNPKPSLLTSTSEK